MSDQDTCVYAKDDSRFRTHCVEAVLYEGMCALFNLALEADLRRPQPEPSSSLKQRLASQRATVVAAFNLIEACLNGIAFDYVELHPDQIDDESKVILTECVC
jgi:hypothetical protein